MKYKHYTINYEINYRYNYKKKGIIQKRGMYIHAFYNY